MGAVYAYTPTLLLTYHALYSMGYDNRIQNGPHNCRGPAKAHGSKAKPTSWVSAIKSKHSEGRSNTKGGQQLVHIGPHRGDPMFSSFVSESQLGDFLHAPSCGLACSRLSFPDRDYPGKSLETTCPEFPRGRGEHMLLFSPMERYLPLLALTLARCSRLYSNPNLALQCQVLGR
jgi:hypothetical protein